MEFDRRVRDEKDAAVRLAKAEADAELKAAYASLRQQRETAAAEREAALQKAAAETASAMQGLRERLAVAEAEKALAVHRAVAEQEKARSEQDRQIVELQGRIAQMEGQFRLEQEQAEAKQALIVRQKDEEIAYYKDLKARQSTKMVGETLEQHCEIEFNRLRAAAFPGAYFEKDNDASEGSKGDYIFRDFDENGEEYISIMFDMKTELDETATKHKNEDFLKKLDKDRRAKHCEYAVLVSLLEADSELYNTGIVDVSYRYPKMYVIRPQFFISLISLLRNAAQGGLEYRRKLAEAKAQDLDLQSFADQLMGFKDRFSNSYRLASDRFGDAIREIDKSIRELEKVKESLRVSADHLRRANTQADDLSIKRLTKGTPGLAAKFEEAGIPLE